MLHLKRTHLCKISMRHCNTLKMIRNRIRYTIISTLRVHSLYVFTTNFVTTLRLSCHLKPLIREAKTKNNAQLDTVFVVLLLFSLISLPLFRCHKYVVLTLTSCELAREKTPNSSAKRAFDARLFPQTFEFSTTSSTVRWRRAFLFAGKLGFFFEMRESTMKNGRTSSV